MFEGQTLGSQQEFQKERGWKPEFNPLTYCTAEAVLWRKPGGAANVLDLEILDAERTSGAPDCLGRRQGKWGTYVIPSKDPTARHAIQREVKAAFGWDLSLDRFNLAGIVGPWLHQATMRLEENTLVLNIHNSQMEQTPFEAKLFSANATGHGLDPTGRYTKATKDARWITLHNLVAEQGENPLYLYWQMIALAVQRHMGEVSNNYLNNYYAPGEYKFPVRQF